MHAYKTRAQDLSSGPSRFRAPNRTFSTDLQGGRDAKILAPEYGREKRTVQGGDDGREDVRMGKLPYLGMLGLLEESKSAIGLVVVEEVVERATRRFPRHTTNERPRDEDS